MTEPSYQCPYCDRQLRVDNAIVAQLARAMTANGNLRMVLAHIAAISKDEIVAEIARIILRDGSVLAAAAGQHRAEDKADAGADRGGAEAGQHQDH